MRTRTGAGVFSELPELHRLYKLLAEAFGFCADGLLSSVHLVHLAGPRLGDLEPERRGDGERVGGEERGWNEGVRRRRHRCKDVRVPLFSRGLSPLDEQVQQLLRFTKRSIGGQKCSDKVWI